MVCAFQHFLCARPCCCPSAFQRILPCSCLTFFCACIITTSHACGACLTLVTRASLPSTCALSFTPARHNAGSAWTGRFVRRTAHRLTLALRRFMFERGRGSVWRVLRFSYWLNASYAPARWNSACWRALTCRSTCARIDAVCRLLFSAPKRAERDASPVPSLPRNSVLRSVTFLSLRENIVPAAMRHADCTSGASFCLHRGLGCVPCMAGQEEDFCSYPASLTCPVFILLARTLFFSILFSCSRSSGAQ